MCTSGWICSGRDCTAHSAILWDAEPWCLHHQPSVRLLNKPLTTTNTDLHRSVNSTQACSHGLQMSIFVCFYLQNWTRDKGSSTCLCPEGSSVPLLLASMVYAHFLLHVSQQQANQAPAGLLSEEILIWSTNAWNSCSANWCAECAQELINMSETKSAQWLLEKKKKEKRRFLMRLYTNIQVDGSRNFPRTAKNTVKHHFIWFTTISVRARIST